LVEVGLGASCRGQPHHGTPWFLHTQDETIAFFPVERQGPLVTALDRIPRCTGRIVGAPPLSDVGQPTLNFVTDNYIASVRKVTEKVIRHMPPLARFKGKPVAFVACRYEYYDYTPSRKLLRRSITIVSDGQRATRSFAFRTCNFGLFGSPERKACSQKTWYG